MNKRNVTRRQWLAGLLAIVFVFSGSPVVAGQFDTPVLVERTLDQTMSCIEYAVTGVSLRVIWTPYGPYYFWTAHVRHNSPDLLSLVHPQLDGMPYQEYNALFGNAYPKTAARIFTVGAIPIGGGHNHYGKWHRHQAVRHLEATVLGHPVAMLLDSSGWNGIRMKAPRHQRDSKSTPDKYLGDFPDSNWSGSFDEQMNLQQAQEIISDSPIVSALEEMIATIQPIASSLGSSGNSPFCPVDSSPFEPYYLSGIDAWMWRIGYPLTDISKSATIVNPLSRDIIGTNGERWGHLYPRYGGINQAHSAKAAAVIARRSMDVLGNDRQLGRIYREPDYEVKTGVWAKLHPVAATNAQCHRKIANTGTIIEDADNYAWNFWTAHNCDLDRRGVHVFTIPLGPIYVTGKVPE